MKIAPGLVIGSIAGVVQMSHHDTKSLTIVTRIYKINQIVLTTLSNTCTDAHCLRVPNVAITFSLKIVTC